MTAGVITLVVVLAVVTPAGLAWRRRQGELRVAAPGRARVAGRPATRVPAPGQRAPGQPDPGPAPVERDILSAADLRYELGPRATLVQFSSAFCAPCRATRQVLGEVAGMVDGVQHVEIDAESRLDLVRRLGVLSTPTVLVLGPAGVIARRASGQPRKADVIAALGELADGQYAAGRGGEAAGPPAGD